MSEVVLRCPHCGTTQAAAGECEACHEAEVRYFCPNHSPGLWLNGPACAECGARVERARVAAERAERERATTRGRDRARPAGAGAAGLPPPVREGPRSASPFGTPRRPPESARAADEAWRAGATPVPVGRGDERGVSAGWPVGAPPIRVRTLPLLGCVGRLFAFAMLAALVLAMATCWFLGGSVGVYDWVVDTGQQIGIVEGVPAQTQRGIEAYRAGDVALAQRELAEAARSYRRSALALVYLARIRMDAGDDFRAREYLREAVTREPNNALVHRELAGVHLQRARRARAVGADELAVRNDLLTAEQHYALALQLDPSDREARGYHGCVLADLGQSVNAERQIAAAGAGPWESCRLPSVR